MNTAYLYLSLFVCWEESLGSVINSGGLRHIGDQVLALFLYDLSDRLLYIAARTCDPQPGAAG